MGFSRQEYLSGLPCPTAGDLPNPGIKPGCPALQVDSLPANLPGKPREGPVSLQSKRSEEAAEEKSHAHRGWLMKLQ